MRVHDDRQVDRILQRGDEVVRGLGRQDTGHVLDAYGADAHLRHLLGKLHIAVERVDRACGVRNGTGRHRPRLDRRLDGDAQVVNVVERVKDADYVYAVADGRAHKAADYIVRIVLVAEYILPAEQHLELSVRHLRADLAQAFPRILVEVAQANVERRAAPALDGIESRLVHRLKDWLKFFIRKSCGNERLVRIAQHGFCELYVHGSSCFIYMEIRTVSPNSVQCIITFVFPQGQTKAQNQAFR